MEAYCPRVGTFVGGSRPKHSSVRAMVANEEGVWIGGVWRMLRKETKACLQCHTKALECMRVEILKVFIFNPINCLEIWKVW